MGKRALDRSGTIFDTSVLESYIVGTIQANGPLTFAEISDLARVVFAQQGIPYTEYSVVEIFRLVKSLVWKTKMLKMTPAQGEFPTIFSPMS